MFPRPDFPKAGLNINREVRRVPSLDLPSKCCSDLGEEEISFDLKLTNTAEENVEVQGDLYIHCGAIFYVHVSYPFHFKEIDHEMDKGKLTEMATHMFNFLKSCFLEYSEEEQNRNMPEISIGDKVLEKFLLSPSFNTLLHSFNAAS